MKHQLNVSDNGTFVAHYAPNTEILTIHKFPPKQSLSQNTVSPIESLTLRISPVSSLCIHPTLPVLLGIVMKKSTTSIPRGPASSNSIKLDINNLTTKSTNVADDTDNIKSNSSKSKISLTLYSYYNKLISTPLIIEVEAPDNGTISPHTMKYSKCGKYLALHTRIYSTSLSETSFQIYIFDIEDNYSFVTHLKLDSGLEDIEWNLKSDIILGAGTDGQLYIYKFCDMKLSLIKSLNLSSSSLTSIAYSEPVNSNDLSSKLGLLIGTRDGNSLFIDPITMSCTHSLLNNIDYPISKVSIGPNGISLINYVSYNNAPSQIIQILNNNDNVNNEKIIGRITDLYPSYNQNNYSTGCGGIITKYGIVVYIKRDGKICFKNIQEFIQKSTKKQNISSSETTLKAQSSSENPRKRSVDLFDRFSEKETIKKPKTTQIYNSTNNANNSNYYDRDVELRRERYRRMGRNSKP